MPHKTEAAQRPGSKRHRQRTQVRLLEILRAAPAGLAVDALKRTLGITTNAVRQHLAALERDGLVEFEPVKARRGRPEHRYRLTAAGQETFPRRYRELAEALLDEFSESLGGSALDAAMYRAGRRVGLDAGHGAAPVAATARLMRELGYEAETKSAGSKTEEIVAHNCVFHRLAEKYPAVCRFDIGFMEAATGRAVEHRECMVRGGSCCRFHFGASRTAIRGIKRSFSPVSR
ncbi:MAG: MarR family transcriptional regulator [Sinobacteraceae bacterium]|nr:MarR family transcriptional regulator [Nevskiaceae bacterium]